VPSKDPIQRFEDILKQRHPHPGVHEGDGLELLAEELCPDVPWADVRALGNFLRHEYDRVDPARVWLTIEDDLGPLRSAAQRALERLRRP
jgi:hypothetical protein